MAITLNTWVGTYKFGRSTDPEMRQVSAALDQRVNRITKRHGDGLAQGEEESLIEQQDERTTDTAVQAEK